MPDFTARRSTCMSDNLAYFEDEKASDIPSEVSNKSSDDGGGRLLLLLFIIVPPALLSPYYRMIYPPLFSFPIQSRHPNNRLPLFNSSSCLLLSLVPVVVII